MKCISFYCNIAHELKGTGMEAKGTYNQVYVRRKKNRNTLCLDKAQNIFNCNFMRIFALPNYQAM
jgi:hypothetical protein